jgi:hypothetical protein
MCRSFGAESPTTEVMGTSLPALAYCLLTGGTADLPVRGYRDGVDLGPESIRSSAMHHQLATRVRPFASTASVF